MSQKLIFAITNYLFSHFTNSLFISIKFISISRLKFRLDIFNIQKLKDLSNIFIYQKKRSVLNKISSIKSQGLVTQILRKLGFKLLDAYKKKSVFQPKIRSLLLFIREFSKHDQFTLNYSVEYLTRIIFCESVQGVSHMPYSEDFSHFGQKEQLKIKMKLKQRKTT